MIVVLTGNNSYLVGQELQDIIAKFTLKHGESIERFDASDITSIDGPIDAVRSISFLEPRKLVIIRSFTQLKELIDRIEDLIEQTADTTDLILVDNKLDKRTAAYKYLIKSVDVRVFNELYPADIVNWLLTEANKLKIKLGRREAQYLMNKIGVNQLRLRSELEKLSITGALITVELIDQLVEATPQSKVFDMLDALFDGKPEIAWKLYLDQRAQGEEPQKIVAMITWQLQQLTLAVFAPDKDKATLINVGMSPYSAQKSLMLARTISKEDLRFFINELATIDYQSKTSADIESALAVYFSEIATVSSTS